MEIWQMDLLEEMADRNYGGHNIGNSENDDKPKTAEKGGNKGEQPISKNDRA